MALKLHRQFTHPAHDKLINLINNAGNPWSNNKDLKEEIQQILENCSICKIYKKTPQACCGITHSQNILRDSRNGLKVLLWGNIITSC